MYGSGTYRSCFGEHKTCGSLLGSVWGQQIPPTPLLCLWGPRSEGEPSRNCVGMAGHSGEGASPQDSRSTSPLPRPPDFSHQGEGAPCGQTQLLQGNRKFGFLLQKWLLLAWSGQTHKHVNEAHLLWVSLEFWPRSCGLSSRRPNTSLHRNKNNFEMQNREHGSHLETISSKISYIDKCAVFMREH